MLVLTRRLGESIIINGNIEVSIEQISGKQIRIGIEAPKDIDIHRKEVQDIVNLDLLSKKINQKPETLQ
jgi:carbon storage regulator